MCLHPLPPGNLSKLTDLREPWYEHHATRGHSTFVLHINMAVI